jgi:two-component system chemotaxis response regulator CheY
MTKRVLDVGQCDPDHTSIRRLIEDNFDAEVVRTHGLEDTLAELAAGAFELVLINRKLDRDYSDGIEILRAIKADGKFADLAVMLVTNFDEHQQEAVDAGGERGFGKAELYHAETRERLAKILA